jgi:phenylalanyl-tRNA synthetase beta chain
VKILVSWLRDFVDVPVGPAELGLALTHCGFELAAVEPVSSAPGEPEDAVLDLEITANRPDCLNVLGMAREVATRFGLPLRAPAPAPPDGGDQLPIRVTIEAPDLCPRYAAGMADVRIAPSPDWMVRRLAAAGVRAINNVVDVTNYVLLELGHPLHAFDYERLADRALVIRRARPGERLTTLDGQDRELDAEMLVIADASRAQAVAGVMGGGDSEVSGATRVIALESAYFLPRSVRRTSKRLGLSTEASYRFERGADPDAPVRAMARALGLLAEIGAGRPRAGYVDARPSPRQDLALPLRGARVARVLGREVAPADVERILAGLGFAADREPGTVPPVWRVRVPSWRGDVTREIDLVEEVARHDGYDRLPSTFPANVVAPAAPDARLERDRLARRLALSAGFSECITFTFIERAAATPFVAEAEIVPLANPLSEKLAVLRPSLLPSLVDSLAHNRRRERRDVRLFEHGARFSAGSGETRGIAFAWTGAAEPEHWTGSGRPVDFFDVKGLAEMLCAGLGLTARFEREAAPWLVPGRSAGVTVSGRRGGPVRFGTIGQLLPAIADGRGVPGAAQDEIYVAEFDLDAVAEVASIGDDVRVVALPSRPAIVRDVSVLVDEGLPAAALRATIHASAPATLVDVREFARYSGKGVPEGQVSLSFRLTFRAPDRTLTDDEVQRETDALVAALAAHGARLR